MTVVPFLAVSLLRADFSYTETSRSRLAEEMRPHMSADAWAWNNRTETSKTIIKGRRSATIGPERTTITDLDQRTVTTIDHARKTWSVSKPGARPAPPPISVKATGQTKTIRGFPTKEYVLQTGSGIWTMKMTYWCAPVPGAEEARDFWVEVMRAGFDSSVLATGEAFARIEGFPVESLTELGKGTMVSAFSGFSTAPVDASLFQIPAGYTQVDDGKGPI